MRCGLQSLEANPSSTPLTKGDSSRNEKEVVNLLAKFSRKLQERAVWLRNKWWIISLCVQFVSELLLLLVLVLVLLIFGGHGAGFRLTAE
jgi:hypothetical protein